MKNIKEFLNTTSEIRHGDRLTSLVGVTILTGMALVLNHKLFSARLDNIEKDYKIKSLETKLDVMKVEKEHLEEEINDFE